MKFQIEGLEEPVTLPDEYINAGAYGRIQRFIYKHPEAGEIDLTQDHTFLREVVGVLTNDPDFEARTAETPMNPANRDTWFEIAEHIGTLVANMHRVEGDVLERPAVTAEDSEDERSTGEHPDPLVPTNSGTD